MKHHLSNSNEKILRYFNGEYFPGHIWDDTAKRSIVTLKNLGFIRGGRQIVITKRGIKYLKTLKKRAKRGIHYNA